LSGPHVSFCWQSDGCMHPNGVSEPWLPPCPPPEKMGHPARTLASRTPKPSRESLFIPSPESTRPAARPARATRHIETLARAVPPTSHPTMPRFERVSTQAVKPCSRLRVAGLRPFRSRSPENHAGKLGLPCGLDSPRLRSRCYGVRNRARYASVTALSPGVWRSGSPSSRTRAGNSLEPRGFGGRAPS
jgi:hypothetical protein